MQARYRWTLLILAILFVVGGAYVVRHKTGSGVNDPASKIITPNQPPRQHVVP